MKTLGFWYKHARPAVTVDIIARSAADNTILLVKRKNEPFKDLWALPGGFVEVGEDPVDSAKRELFEETGLTATWLSSDGVYGRPDRDPREHVISLVYYTIFETPEPPFAGDDAKEARWFPMQGVLDGQVPMAFDHQAIISSYNGI